VIINKDLSIKEFKLRDSLRKFIGIRPTSFIIPKANKANRRWLAIKLHKKKLHPKT
jgi:hypothetical protein